MRRDLVIGSTVLGSVTLVAGGPTWGISATTRE